MASSKHHSQAHKVTSTQSLAVKVNRIMTWSPNHLVTMHSLLFFKVLLSTHLHQKIQNPPRIFLTLNIRPCILPTLTPTVFLNLSFLLHPSSAYCQLS